MKQIFKIFIIFSILLFFVAPVFSFAVDNNKNLVPCGTEYTTAKDGTKTISNPCDGVDGWKNLMQLVNNFINFILFKMAVPIAAIMFAYAGFTLVTSGGSSEKKSVAKNTFTSVAMGLVFAMAAWLIINTILQILGYDGKWIGF